MFRWAADFLERALDPAHDLDDLVPQVKPERAFFYLRKESFYETLDADKRAGFFESSSSARMKLHDLKQ